MGVGNALLLADRICHSKTSNAMPSRGGKTARASARERDLPLASVMPLLARRSLRGTRSGKACCNGTAAGDRIVASRTALMTASRN